jgi:hypothetical protein
MHGELAFASVVDVRLDRAASGLLCGRDSAGDELLGAISGALRPKDGTAAVSATIPQLAYTAKLCHIAVA